MGTRPPSTKICTTGSAQECFLLLRQQFKFPLPPHDSSANLSTPSYEATNGIARINQDSPEELYIKFINFLWNNDKRRLQAALARFEDSSVLSEVGSVLGLKFCGNTSRQASSERLSPQKTSPVETNRHNSTHGITTQVLPAIGATLGEEEEMQARLLSQFVDEMKGEMVAWVDQQLEEEPQSSANTNPMREPPAISLIPRAFSQATSSATSSFQEIFSENETSTGVTSQQESFSEYTGNTENTTCGSRLPKLNLKPGPMGDAKKEKQSNEPEYALLRKKLRKVMARYEGLSSPPKTVPMPCAWDSRHMSETPEEIPTDVDEPDSSDMAESDDEGGVCIDAWPGFAALDMDSTPPPPISPVPESTVRFTKVPENIQAEAPAKGQLPNTSSSNYLSPGPIHINAWPELADLDFDSPSLPSSPILEPTVQSTRLSKNIHNPAKSKPSNTSLFNSTTNLSSSPDHQILGQTQCSPIVVMNLTIEQDEGSVFRSIFSIPAVQPSSPPDLALEYEDLQQQQNEKKEENATLFNIEVPPSAVHSSPIVPPLPPSVLTPESQLSVHEPIIKEEELIELDSDSENVSDPDEDNSSEYNYSEFDVDFRDLELAYYPTSPMPTLSQFTAPKVEAFFELPYWAQYEATRVALLCGVTPSSAVIAMEFLHCIDDLKTSCMARDNQSSWLEALQNFGKSKNQQFRLSSHRVSNGLWGSLQQYTRHGAKIPDTLYLTGTLIPTNDQAVGPLRVSLNPISHTTSNRFFRRFGSHRFLALKLPPIKVKQFKHLKYKIGKFDTPENIQKSLIDFVVNKELELLGRTWRGMYIKEPKKAEASQGTKKNEKYLQAIFFATKGEGISSKDEMTIAELIDWHIPLDNIKNLKSTVAKLWSRVSLGFSSTKPSVTFTRDQICPDVNHPRSPGERYRPDPDHKSETGKVMNDGCSLVSLAVMRKIKEDFKLSEAPTAVQGRIGGAKGLWIIDPRTLEWNPDATDEDFKAEWIRVTESQLKYEEHDTANPDPAWTTLDVLGISKPPATARINNQLIPILENRGVPYPVLETMVEEHLEAELKTLFDAMKEPISLRNWLYNKGNVANTRVISGGIDYLGALPSDQYEKLLLFFDAGFRFESMGYLVKDLRNILERHWDKLKEKMHIEIPQSTSLFCVADPTGTLKEGEVSLHFSQGLIDERTGRPRHTIQGEILVARNPALLPTDIQKVTAVDNRKLRELKDVIVFSTKGDKSLASLLSGGDYDGDKCWICWDQRIVTPFVKENPELPQFPDLEEKWFVKNTPQVQYLVPSIVGGVDKEVVTAEFLKQGALCALSDTTGMLGLYTSRHSEWSKKLTLQHPVCVELAHICSNLVDAQKQGLQLRSEHSSMLKELGAPAKGLPDNHNYILDRLKCFIGNKISSEDSQFNSLLPAPSSQFDPIDRDLTALSDFEQAQCLKANASKDFKDCLNNLRCDIGEVQSKWTRTMRTFRNSLDPQNQGGALRRHITQTQESSSQADDPPDYTTFVNETYDEFMDIKPRPEESPHPIIQRWRMGAERGAGELYSDWNLLKASVCYDMFRGDSKFVWNCCGVMLCRLKVDAIARSGSGVGEGPRSTRQGTPGGGGSGGGCVTGRTRFMTEQMYVSLKTDKRALGFEALDTLEEREEVEVEDGGEGGSQDAPQYYR